MTELKNFPTSITEEVQLSVIYGESLLPVGMVEPKKHMNGTPAKIGCDSWLTCTITSSSRSKGQLVVYRRGSLHYIVFHFILDNSKGKL